MKIKIKIKMRNVLVITVIVAMVLKVEGQNVGIGTDDPQSNLHVIGDIRSDSMYVSNRLGIGTATPDRPLTIKSANDNFMGFENGEGMEKWLWRLQNDQNLILSSGAGSDVLLAHQNGNISIGAYQAAAKLHVATLAPGMDANDLLLIENYGSGGAGIQFRNAAVFSSDWQSYVDYNGDFNIGRQNMGDFFKIQTGGHVGIGMINPSYTLDIHKLGPMVSVARFRASEGHADILIENETKQIKLGVNDLGGYVDSSHDLSFNHGGQTKMTLFSDGHLALTIGHLGLGTSSPSYRLDAQLQGPHATVARFKANGGFADILIENGEEQLKLGVDNIDGGYVTTGAGHNLRLQTGSTDRVFINHITGNVGIGTSAPDKKLDVNGDIKLSGLIVNESIITPTLQNGWENYNDGFETAGFFKDKFGIVHLQGLVRSGTSGHIMTLPTGYRPGAIQIFTVVSGTGFARLDVNPNGQVIVVGNDNNAYVSLNGISFRT